MGNPGGRGQGHRQTVIFENDHVTGAVAAVVAQWSEVHLVCPASGFRSRACTHRIELGENEKYGNAIPQSWCAPSINVDPVSFALPSSECRLFHPEL